MNRSLTFGTLALLWLSLNTAHAQFASAVLSYDPGTNPAAGYSNPTVAVGPPERFTGEGSFPGAVTVFNPPFGTDELVSIGTNGHLTLRLSHYVVPDPSGPEIGVFTNAGIADESYPAGQAGNPLFAFGVDSALLEVSEYGASWVSLGVATFDIPTQGYTDAAATVASDFTKPFSGLLSDFNGLALSDPANPDVLDLLAGSGGGTWLDVSSSGLAKVGYVRFSVPATIAANFELDAVSIAASAMGGRVPEPSASVLIIGAVVCLARGRF